MKPTTPKRVQVQQELADVSRIVTPEKLLLETLERIARLRDGRFAMHFHLSRLLPQYRDESYLRIAVRVIDPLASGYRCQIFLLGNGDIVVLGRDVPAVDIESSIFKLRTLFGKDPLAQEDEGDGTDHFVSWHELETELPAFMRTAEELHRQAEARKLTVAARTQKPEPMSSKHLEAVLTSLERTSVLPMVRRQAAARFGAGAQAEVVFQEFFFSMADIQKTIAPRLDLFANRWLFLHFTGELDLMMLAALTQLRLHHRPPIISVNLNLSSISDRRFKAFLDSLAPEQSLIVELEPVDAFCNLAAFARAKEMLWARGHKILMDRLTPLSFEMIDLSLFEADYVKVSWSPDLGDPRRAKIADDFHAAVLALGADRFILSRCDSEAAVKWGMQLGIPWFQGRFVDAMLGAVAMATCKDSKACTLAQCINRRTAIAGPLRAECTNHPQVDSLSAIRSPAR
ncbi:MAG: EAL domain-containing protein [Alphaproteobacteria bacterium]|nr:EAL domain-containing protein [Alphaproteobacteria bacterium]MBF0129103.1 EAL domain-containing protein [Alphaproteobacteria bacterium]